MRDAWRQGRPIYVMGLVSPRVCLVARPALLNWDGNFKPSPNRCVRTCLPGNTAPQYFIIVLKGIYEMNSPPIRPTRFVALDVHKRYIVAAAIDAEQNIVLRPRRVRLEEFEGWASAHLEPTDSVVLEATTNAWHLCDQLHPLVGSVTVAHPLLVKLIASARVKTDSRDAISLARLLAAGLIPAVWVPPEEVRELRSLVNHRQRLVKQRTQTRNRLHAVLHRHNLVPPGKSPFSRVHRGWWDRLGLSVTEKLQVRQDLATVDHLEPLIMEVEKELARLTTIEPWADRATFLVQLPGIGVVNAMVLLAAIGDISRFESARKLVGYAGLGPSVHDSGQTHRTGKITKEGRREIRTTMVEAAWAAVRTHPYWRSQFERLRKRAGDGKAIVAIARKLLVVVWHVLTERVADRYVDVERVAFKFMNWSWALGKENRHGLDTASFIRGELTRLGIGDTLSSISRSGRIYRLPPIRDMAESQAS